MLRSLLNIASIVCLVLCVALMGMWVRSYQSLDELRGRLDGMHAFAADSAQGRLLLAESLLNPARPPNGVWPWTTKSQLINDKMTIATTPFGRGLLSSVGIAVSPSLAGWDVMFPYWLLVFLTGLAAVICRIRWPLKFTLRALFVLTTFLAMVFGMIATLDKSWIGQINATPGRPPMPDAGVIES